MVDSAEVLQTLVPLIRGTIAKMSKDRNRQQTSAWMDIDVVGRSLGIPYDKVKTVLRRTSVKKGLAAEHFATCIRSTYVYAYTVREDGTEWRDDMQNGEVKLVPGVLENVPSTSNPGETHEVRLSKKGNVYCDCEGYAFRSHCSHIDSVVQKNPMLKVLVVASIRNRIAHLKETLAKLDEE